MLRGRDKLNVLCLSQKDNPPPVTLVNASGVPANFVMPTDYSFWELLNKVIQEEPPEGSDPTTLGLFASIGIEKGKPFAPDARMKDILTDAANIGAVTARALALNIRGRDAFFYPDSKSSWRLPFFGGYRFQSQPGVSNLDGAAFYYFFATGVTPAMEEKMVLVKAEEMASGILQQGSVNLYGFHFDTASAALKPESDATLDEVAKLLKSDAALRLLVVGHTDTVGKFEGNIELSQNRAASVVAALSKRLPSAASRLTPCGVGYQCPIASNSSDEGRAKNRRVALVKVEN
jgi:outer membrane protein OmpA-like peptidoglycan-associated protein